MQRHSPSTLAATPLPGPWTVELSGIGDLRAAIAAGEERIGHGLAVEGEGARIAASGPSPAVRAGRLPAAVPGCVHLDLLALGLIEDPHRGLNESSQHWIARCRWTYRTSFDAPSVSAERWELLIGGLDTVADVYLNGELLLGARNQHRSYRLDVTGRLQPTGNILEVVFDEQSDWADAQRRLLGVWPGAYPDAGNMMRKMACNFGWDWGPTLVTAGIWKPITLVAWDVGRFDAVRVSATAPARVPHLVATVRAARTGSDPLVVDVMVAGAVASTRLVDGAETRLELDVPDAALWWPHSHGSPTTYDCTISLRTTSGLLLDQVVRTVGFRDVRIVSEADALGRSFELRVNDERVWVRGANWIPDDTFVTRITPERYRARVQQAVEANIDLLRVWGGGLYEADAFYDACDRAGVLVWQDFPFACAAYPEDADTASEVEAEARQAIERLGSHPSLAVWNGSNENIWGWFDWGWQQQLDERPWGLGYYLELLPRLLAELDPDRPYQPSSPWSGSMQVHPNADGHGTAHLWDVWNERDYEAYREHRPRFASEFGYQGPATFPTLLESVGASGLDEDAPALMAHQKARDGEMKLRRGLDRRFPGVTTFDDWHFLTQLEQARALRVGISHLRSLHETCAGSVVWQLNDCWPAVSWSLVDSGGRRKLAWYAVRDAYRDRLVVIRPVPGERDRLDLVLINDDRDAWQVEGRLRRVDFDGVEMAAEPIMSSVAPRSATRLVVPAAVARPGSSDQALLVADVGDVRDTWFFGDDAKLAYPSPIVDVSTVETATGCVVNVVARTLVRELCLFPDRLHPDASAETALFTLLPGERISIPVRSPAPLDVSALGVYPNLRAANDYRPRRAGSGS